jgi:hypothetical protein
MRGNAAMRNTTTATNLCLSKCRDKKESYDQRKTAHMRPLSTEPETTYITYTYKMPYLISGFHRDQLRRCEGWQRTAPPSLRSANPRTRTPMLLPKVRDVL